MCERVCFTATNNNNWENKLTIFCTVNANVSEIKYVYISFVVYSHFNFDTILDLKFRKEKVQS